MNPTSNFNVTVPNVLDSRLLGSNSTRNDAVSYRNELQRQYDATQAEKETLQKQIASLQSPTKAEQTAERTLLDLQQGLRQGLTNIENKPIAMEFITGQQSAVQKQGALDVLAASENLQAITKQKQSMLDTLKEQLGMKQKNFEDYLGLSKEFRSIDKDARDTARQTLSDILSFAEGKSYDQLDSGSQQAIINAVADSPLSLGLIKGAMLKSKIAYDEARSGGVSGQGTVGVLSGLPSGIQTKFLGLLDDFDKQTQNQRQVITSSSNIKSIAERAKTDPTAQVALVFQYMKALDPNSTVREGEYATAKNTTGIAGRVRNTYNKVLNGKFLTSEQIDSFVKDTDKLSETAVQQIKTRSNEFDRRASLFNIPQGLFYQSIGVETPQDGSNNITKQILRDPQTGQVFDASNLSQEEINSALADGFIAQ